jgi:SAM-dependent methyltransferase
MKGADVDLSTDAAWEEWGRRDPYFATLTDPKFRRSDLTELNRREFFESGRLHVGYVMQMVRKHIDDSFEPKRILDFGCGVGRVLVGFATDGREVIGVDVSPAMLHEARMNCENLGARNVHLLQSDDALSTLTGQFDLIHSCMVFQHIPVERGRAIFSRLLQHLRAGGVGAVHVTYSKSQFAPTHGVAPIAARASTPKIKGVRTQAHRDPEMQMNPYNLNEWCFLMQLHGVNRFQAVFTDHGGELGVFLFFQKP